MRIFCFLILLVPQHLRAQLIFTVAGNGSEIYSNDGFFATMAGIGNPRDVTVSQSGNMYIADYLSHVIRKVNTAGIISRYAGNYVSGSSGMGGPATAASISYPTFITVDTAENVYFTDGSKYVRKVNKAGIISIFAGGGASLGDGGPATNARLVGPVGITSDRSGNVYVCDGSDGRIRKINPGGIIVTVGGNGTVGYAGGDGGAATNAHIGNPEDIKVDASGNLYFADYNDMIIRKISNTGVISTVAGNGYYTYGYIGGYSGDGGPATDAMLNGPTGLGVDRHGNIYISDFGNSLIRKVDSSGIITTLCGWYMTGAFYGNYIPYNFPAEVNGPMGMFVDSADNLFFADAFNNRIRKINFNCIPRVITGPDKICAGSSINVFDSIKGGIWSMSNGKATISYSGLVTGIMAGVDTITYTLSNECGTNSAIKIVTVEVAVSILPITGIDSVCVGAAITLSDPSPGGIWNTSNSSASVNLTGKITGNYAGLDTVYYKINNSCGTFQAQQLIKINPLPPIGVIMGADSVCPGSSVILADSVSGGIWSASNSRAIVVSGIVTGNNQGLDTITYTVSNSCTSKQSKEIRIMPQPFAGSISGNKRNCPGISVLLSDSAPGGIWSNTNSAVTNVVGGKVTGIAGGVDTIIYSVTNSCGTATALFTMTIDPWPNAGVIEGPSVVCVGSLISLAETVLGGIWSAANSNISVAGGVVLGVSIGLDSVIYTTSGNCGSASTSLIITVDSLANAGNIEGLTSVLCTADHLSLTNSISGGAWHSMNTNAIVSDSGGVIANWSGTDTIAYTVTNNCGLSPVYYPITINPTPAAVVSQDGNYLSLPPTFSSYQWTLNGNPISGATEPGYFIVDKGIYSAKISNSYGCSALVPNLTIVDCNADDIQLYPNPANDVLYISWCKKVNVQLRTMSGTFVQIIKNVSEINLSGFQAGVYSLSLFDDSNRLLITREICVLPK